MKEIKSNENKNSINKIDNLKGNENINNKNLSPTFNKLTEMQALLRKESSLKELCK